MQTGGDVHGSFLFAKVLYLLTTLFYILVWTVIYMFGKCKFDFDMKMMFSMNDVSL